MGMAPIFGTYPHFLNQLTFLETIISSFFDTENRPLYHLISSFFDTENRPLYHLTELQCLLHPGTSQRSQGCLSL